MQIKINNNVIDVYNYDIYNLIKIPSNSTVGKLTLACSSDTFSINVSNASCDAMKGKHRSQSESETNYNAHLVFTSPHFISQLGINIGLLRSSNNNYVDIKSVQVLIEFIWCIILWLVHNGHIIFECFNTIIKDQLNHASYLITTIIWPIA